MVWGHGKQQSQSRHCTTNIQPQICLCSEKLVTNSLCSVMWTGSVLSELYSSLVILTNTTVNQHVDFTSRANADSVNTFNLNNRYVSFSLPLPTTSVFLRGLQSLVLDSTKSLVLKRQNRETLSECMSLDRLASSSRKHALHQRFFHYKWLWILSN